MATRRFLFQSSEGYADTAALTDDTSLAKVTLSGLGGVAIDAGGFSVTNLPLVPSLASDATSKSYVDSVATGLDVKSSVRLATTAALAAYTPSGSGVGKILTADANGALSIDSVLTVIGDRVLIKDESSGTHADNGIYTVTQVGSAGTPFILTRAIDFDQTAEVTAGSFMFIEEGTINSDTGWVLITNNPITVDTTALTFTQFTGTGSIIAGAGLVKTGSTIAAELDTAASAQGAGADGGSSGLEFDVSGVAGKLRAAVNGTGGLHRTGTGLSVLIDDTPDTLDSTAAGLKVVGVPLQFKINDVATATTVTAANLGTLTGGSNADALHKHSKVKFTATASGAVTKGDGVYFSANNSISTGDCTNDTKSRIVGVADAAIVDTASGDFVISGGPVTGVLSGATAGVRYYMSSAGSPVLVGSLPSAARTIQLGIALNATDLFVQVFDYGKKAA